MNGNFFRQVPNILTLSRMGMAFLFPFINSDLRLAILLLAMMTEYLDGAISRKFHFQTQLGQVLDPIADKMFFVSVALTFLLENQVSLNEVILLAIRDLVVIFGASWVAYWHSLARLKEMKPNILGKITTALQYLNFFYLFIYAGLNPALVGLTAVIGFFAALEYFSRFFPKSHRDHIVRALHFDNRVNYRR